MLQRTLQSCILTAAFFIPFFSHSNDIYHESPLVKPDTDIEHVFGGSGTGFGYFSGGNKATWAESAFTKVKGAHAAVYATNEQFDAGECEVFRVDIDTESRFEALVVCQFHGVAAAYTGRNNYSIKGQSISTKEVSKGCPPNSAPENTFEVMILGKPMCAIPKKPTPDENNPNDCPNLSGMDIPELTFGYTDQTTMCFPNSGGGDVCKYHSSTGVFQLPPSLGESVNCDTGEPENPFPDNPEDTDTPDSDGCVIKKGKKYCEAKEEDNCNIANAAVKVGDTWDTSVLECGAGCGDIGGIFYCPETPKDDQEPEINENCTDEVFRLANPSVCSGKTDDSTDKNGDGKTDNTDIVKGLNTGNQLAESGLSELKKGNAEQLAEQKKLNEKSFATNQLLSSLNNQVSESNKILDKIEKNTSGETSVENSFDPAKSTSFYERTYKDGIKGVWSANEAALKQTEFVKFLDQFNPVIASAKPNSQICFNLGPLGNFGCKDLPLPDVALLAILKIFILVTAAFACRRIVFGG